MQTVLVYIFSRMKTRHGLFLMTAFFGIIHSLSLAGLLISSAILSSCGTLALRPFSGAKPEYDCFKDNERTQNGFSQIEEDMRKAGALGTRTVNLSSEIGMIEKTARLYVLNKSRYILVFHFLHVVDLEITDLLLSISEGSREIAGGILKTDTKYTIGGATDEYLYYYLNEAEAKEMASSENVSIAVGDMPFGIPYLCRETFRDALGIK